MWHHYVYIHKQQDTGEVFYVGKGTVRARKKSIDYERAHCRDSRSEWWCRTVAKHGITIEIVASFIDDISSQSFERALISYYGRANLVNLTDGGDGSAGICTSAETRHKRSVNARGPRPQAWIDSIRAARKNGGNGGVVKRGDRLPESWRKAISAGQSGPNNYMRGKTGSDAPNRREVIDTATGNRYSTVSLAAESHGLKMKTLYNWLSGHRPNPTSMEFA